MSIARLRRQPRPRAARGFTLIELVVALAILGVLLVLAAPGFAAFMRSAELNAAAHAFVASLNAARSEAMKRNLPAQVMPLDPGGADWTRGFIAFVDVDRDGAYTEGVDLAVLRQALDAPYLAIQGTGTANAAPAYVRYDGSGFARKADGSSSNLSIGISRTDVRDAELPAQTRRIFVARTGRLRICTPASANDRSCRMLDADS